MGDFFDNDTKRIVYSVNDPDYVNNSRYGIIKAIKNGIVIVNVMPSVDLKYIKVVNFVPVEMNQSEKDAIDAAEAAAAAQAAEDAKDIELSWSNPECYRRFVRVLLDEINILRGKHNLTDRTLTQLRNAVKNKTL